MIQRLATFCIVAMLSLNLLAQSRSHVVQAGETLYAIARNYNTSVDELRRLNPNTTDNIKVGQSLRIPDSVPETLSECKQMYEVQKKETIFSIARKFGLTDSELIAANPYLANSKLKKGAYLCIPHTAAEKAAAQKAHDEAVAEIERNRIVNFPVLKVAVILPFGLDNAKSTTEANKMLEFYQGFLLAVDSMRAAGTNIEVYAYDEDAGGVGSVLNMPELSNVNLIIGPGRNVDTDAVARFASQHSIPLVVPFSSKEGLVNQSPVVLQVNTPNSRIFNKVCDAFVNKYKGCNVVFVGMNDKTDNADFVVKLKAALASSGTSAQRISFVDMDELESVLKLGVRNIIVPSATSASTLDMLCLKLNNLNLDARYNINLFGYSDWQTASSKSLKNLQRYKACFFTSFYSNQSSWRTRSFNQRYEKWFGHAPLVSFPRYGELGHDIGAFFLRGLSAYGSQLLRDISDLRYTSLEFPFLFERQPSGGFHNLGAYLVEYDSNGNVQVLPF